MAVGGGKRRYDFTRKEIGRHRVYKSFPLGAVPALRIGAPKRQLMKCKRSISSPPGDTLTASIPGEPLRSSRKLREPGFSLRMSGDILQHLFHPLVCGGKAVFLVKPPGVRPPLIRHELEEHRFLLPGQGYRMPDQLGPDPLVPFVSGHPHVFHSGAHRSPVR